MYEILRRSPERPWARPELASPAMLDASPAGGAIVLRLRENRSQLSAPARQCCAVLVAAMLPALKGYWMVPAYCLAAMAALTFALERHAKAKPKCETLQFAEGVIRHRDAGGHPPMKSLALSFAALLPLAAPAYAHDHRAHHAADHGVAIIQGWARETAPGQVNGGGFLTITNNATQADRLVSATSPASATVQLHTMSMDGGIMRMRELPQGIPVPTKGVVELKPGGMHIMFIGLKAPFKPGQTVKLTLRFEKAGAVDVSLPVRPVGAQSGRGMDMAHGHP